ncbi:LuxR family transcriptional regulator [Sphingomonas canadensis]|uniref:LuxR family transcriptional regulator n=1 Tax=Sphingomonas canadensis TaxID=1219257 RepID=A0ABW3HGQ3_9SPHN|nr:LuxR family transcriptional regulator [Sphingomonas canadensis]MCW3838189.1 LuxR family transcriptional regulator [Sphingomonas canadensis]
MARFTVASVFERNVREARELRDLFDLLEECAQAMGFRYFALTHHVDFATLSSGGVRLHNYPIEWQDWFDARSLGRLDPIHRASHVTSHGFTWTQVPKLIQLTSGDRHILEQARRIGIGNGFTVPAHVPGEFSGSCSFAVRPSDDFPEDHVLVAQLVGGLAFETARRLANTRHAPRTGQPMTDRQRDCVLWAARGKTDWEISQILGVSHETVIQHLKHARERYGVQKRAHLAVMALFDGSISFADIFMR